MLELPKNVNQILPDGTIALHVVLRWAINGNKKETFRILLENGGNINYRDAYGFILLHHSIMAGNERIVEFGADLYVSGYWNYSPLERAIRKDNRQIVQLLLKRGICLVARNVDGKNSLEHCLKKKDKKRLDIKRALCFY